VRAKNLLRKTFYPSVQVDENASQYNRRRPKNHLNYINTHKNQMLMAPASLIYVLHLN